MTRVEYFGNTYELTSYQGQPAIRKLDKNGNTARWIVVGSRMGKAIMRKAGMEPAMMPKFSEDKDG